MKKKNLRTLVHLFIILLSSASFSPSTEMPLAGARTGAPNVQSGSDGRMLWNRTYGGPGFEWGSSVQVLGDGGYIIAGETESYGAGELDFYLVRTDSEGNMLWNRTYGGPQFEEASSIQETSDGGYIIVGTISSLDPFSEDVYLVKTDPEGNILWNRTYGRFENEQGYPIFDYGSSVQETSDGGYIIAGHTTVFGMDSDVCLIKTDPEGNTLWNWTYGGPSSGRGYSARETSDGGYVIAGFTKPFMMIGDQEVYLVKTDSGGNMLWNRTYGGPGRDSCSSVQETGDGGYIIAGTTRSPEMDVAIYLIRIAPCPVPSSITCQVSANTTKLGDAVNVSGKVTPSTLHRDIALTYTLPDGTIVTRTVKTDADSVFLDEYAPNAPGSWEVTASMEGDAYYEASTSELVAFTVEKTPLGVPLYLYGSLVVVAIAILAAWLLLRRR